MAFGETRIALGWIGSIISGIGTLMLIGTEGWAGCCVWLLICLAITSSGYEAKKKAANLQKVVYVQQPPVQQVVHHTYQQAPMARPAPAPAPAPVPVSRSPTHNAPPKSQAEWAMDARNLEMARDWERAAQAYQKAGLYAEAGRIRQQHMEKDNSGVNINIDRVGDHIQDSVVMKDDQNQI